jgi:hypothetical protein
MASSSMRTRARSAAIAGSSAGAGQRSSMYSRMIVESNTATSPSISAGTSPRGLTRTNSPPAAPLPMLPGMMASNGTPFSSSAIFTFCP